MAPELLNIAIVEETLMPEQLRSSTFVNTIQMIEDLVDKVFRKHHITSFHTPPPTVRFRVVEEFQRMKELSKVA